MFNVVQFIYSSIKTEPVYTFITISMLKYLVSAFLEMQFCDKFAMSWKRHMCLPLFTNDFIFVMKSACSPHANIQCPCLLIVATQNSE